MPPTAARRHRSKSSVDSLLELVHGLDDHDVHRLLADLNNTTEGNVAVAKAIHIFQRPNSPKFESGPRHVESSSASLLVSRSRRVAAAEGNRGYNNNNNYTHLRLHQATNSPALKACPSPDGRGPTTPIINFSKRISSAPLLDRERMSSRHSPTIFECVVDGQPTTGREESRCMFSPTHSDTFTPRTETHPPSTPERAPPISFLPALTPSPPLDLAFSTPPSPSSTPLSSPPSTPSSSPPPPPPPPARTPPKGPRAYKRISRPHFNFPFSTSSNNTSQASLSVPTLGLPGDSQAKAEDDSFEQEPNLRALLLAAYTLGDKCNLPVPQQPSPLRGPRSMVNLRALRQQDEEFGFDGRRPSTPENMLLEPLPGFGLAAPAARRDPWRIESLCAVLNEA